MIEALNKIRELKDEARAIDATGKSVYEVFSENRQKSITAGGTK